MLDPEQFRLRVIRPSLTRLGLHSPAAEVLLLGTAISESRLSALAQDGGGPALGVYQIEPATHADIWRNYLAYRPVLSARVLALAAGGLGRPEQLVWNLAYATAMARIVYRRRPEPIPPAGDIPALAAYWKAHFNTAAGKGTAAKFIERAGPYLRDGERRSPT
jgi:hypothetical protein